MQQCPFVSMTMEYAEHGSGIPQRSDFKASKKGEKMSHEYRFVTQRNLRLGTMISPLSTHMLRCGQDWFLKVSTCTVAIEWLFWISAVFSISLWILTKFVKNSFKNSTMAARIAVTTAVLPFEEYCPSGITPKVTKMYVTDDWSIVWSFLMPYQQQKGRRILVLFRTTPHTAAATSTSTMATTMHKQEWNQNNNQPTVIVSGNGKLDTSIRSFLATKKTTNFVPWPHHSNNNSSSTRPPSSTTRSKTQATINHQS